MVRLRPGLPRVIRTVAARPDIADPPRVYDFLRANCDGIDVLSLKPYRDRVDN